MKVIFLRHGESYDDIYNEFGGWCDRTPTPKGLELAKIKAKELKEKYPDISKIYSSPLNRALIFAEEVGKEMKIPVEKLVYLMERNTYGLLNGLTKEHAKKKYPELVERFEAQEFIPGSERYDDFTERVAFLVEFLSKIEIKGTLLCVTQGYLMTTLLEEYLGKIRDKITHGSYFVCELDGTKLKFVEASGITFLEKENEEIRKFKK